MKVFLINLYKEYLLLRLRFLSFFTKAGFFSHLRKQKILYNVMHFIYSNKIRGDYLEFGVFEGHTFTSAYHLSKSFKLEDMRFFAFDSFRGLPKLKGIDKESEIFNENDFSCSLVDFEKNLKRHKVNMKKVGLIEGWFDKVLNDKIKSKFGIKKAAIVWVDCDLYSSTVPVLNFITDLLVDGTIIVFDDWFCYNGNPDTGEQKAFYDWIKENNLKYSQYLSLGWGGKAFIIHK